MCVCHDSPTKEPFSLFTIKQTPKREVKCWTAETKEKPRVLSRPQSSISLIREKRGQWEREEEWEEGQRKRETSLPLTAHLWGRESRESLFGTLIIQMTQTFLKMPPLQFIEPSA